jgi:pSer/pThr/pTyr-binding forkhead associated (FHA) protein
VQLIYTEGVPTSSISASSLFTQDFIEEKPVVAQEVAESAAPVLDALISLNIISSGDILPISSQKEITLGRVSEGQPIIPDIDLTPYKAYESGVSRMHASIKSMDEQVMVTDLGSANGTRINGMKISAHIPYPIKHGDILTLGKFKIQVLLKSKVNGG